MDQNADALLAEAPAISEKEALKHLRRRKPARRVVPLHGMTLGERVADLVAAVTGSWTFIIVQSVVLFLWIAVNAYSGKAWDPYPFILLNLLLSFQAAYAAPIIMMAQNRQADIDRKKAEKDYDVNLKAELEIELLHQKMDLMREQEIKRLTELVEELIEKNRKEQP
ncbi:DUF1003 domain-containing protein [Dongia deserti]|uniref:DUF1003 domain-containing protein n=1 Tax=Dongia deserti TaxID=2268030 RepID=UPI000E64D7F5|nr:DUF1003 domain-containing protein [Dongia deserti]